MVSVAAWSERATKFFHEVLCGRMKHTNISGCSTARVYRAGTFITRYRSCFCNSISYGFTCDRHSKFVADLLILKRRRFPIDGRKRTTESISTSILHCFRGSNLYRQYDSKSKVKCHCLLPTTFCFYNHLIKF